MQKLSSGSIESSSFEQMHRQNEKIDNQNTNERYELNSVENGESSEDDISSSIL